MFNCLKYDYIVNNLCFCFDREPVLNSELHTSYILPLLFWPYLSMGGIVRVVPNSNSAQDSTFGLFYSLSISPLCPIGWLESLQLLPVPLMTVAGLKGSSLWYGMRSSYLWASLDSRYSCPFVPVCDRNHSGFRFCHWQTRFWTLASQSTWF